MPSEIKPFNLAPILGIKKGKTTFYNQETRFLDESSNILIDSNGIIVSRPIGDLYNSNSKTAFPGGYKLFSADAFVVPAGKNILMSNQKYVPTSPPLQREEVQHLMNYATLTPEIPLQFSATNGDILYPQALFPYVSKLLQSSGGVSFLYYGRTFSKRYVSGTKGFYFGYDGAFLEDYITNKYTQFPYIGSQPYAFPSQGVLTIDKATNFDIPDLHEHCKQFFLRHLTNLENSQSFASGKTALDIYNQGFMEYPTDFDTAQVPTATDFGAIVKNLFLEIQAVGLVSYYARYENQDGLTGGLSMPSNLCTVFARPAFYDEKTTTAPNTFRLYWKGVDEDDLTCTVVCPRVKVNIPKSSDASRKRDIKYVYIYRTFIPFSTSNSATQDDASLITINASGVPKQNAIRIYKFDLSSITPTIDDVTDIATQDVVLNTPDSQYQDRYGITALSENWDDKTISSQIATTTRTQPFSPNPYLTLPYSNRPYIVFNDFFFLSKDIHHDDDYIGDIFGKGLISDHPLNEDIQTQHVKYVDINRFDTASIYELIFPPGIDDWIEEKRPFVNTLHNNPEFQDMMESYQQKYFSNVQAPGGNFYYHDRIALTHIDVGLGSQQTNFGYQTEYGITWAHWKYALQVIAGTQQTFWIQPTTYLTNLTISPSGPIPAFTVIEDIAELYAADPSVPIIYFSDYRLMAMNALKDTFPTSAEWAQITSTQLADTQKYRHNRVENVKILDAVLNSIDFPSLNGVTNEFMNYNPPYYGFIDSELFQDRVFLACDDYTRHQVVYSNPSRFNEFPLGNRITLDGASQITGIKSNGRWLYIFTKDGTWIVRNANTPTSIIPEKLSDIGADMPSAIVEIQGVLFTIFKNEIYMFENANVRKLDIKKYIPLVDGSDYFYFENAFDLDNPISLSSYSSGKEEYLVVSFHNPNGVQRVQGTLTTEEINRYAIMVSFIGRQEPVVCLVPNFPVVYTSKDDISITADRERACVLRSKPATTDELFSNAITGYDYSFATEVIQTDMQTSVIPIYTKVISNSTVNNITVTASDNSASTFNTGNTNNKIPLPYIIGDRMRFSFSFTTLNPFELLAIQGLIRLRKTYNNER